MKRPHVYSVWLSGAVLLGCSALAIAQDAPESLLPPGFDKPAPRTPAKAAPPPESAPGSDGPRPTSSPVVQALPGVSSGPAAPSAPVALPKNLPSLEKLEAMSPEELDELFGLKPRFDIPPAARRALTRVGVVDEGEGGLPYWALDKQDGRLVSALLNANSGKMVSRWGHILLRRALASRLDAPQGLAPADFAAQRAALLVRMGEGGAARALVQDIDVASYSPALTQAALDSYVATADFVGACPMVAWTGAGRKDKPWQVLQAMCDAFSGQGGSALARLDRLAYYGAMPRIDMLLMQRYAGSAGKARRAVTIEWDGITDMTPWRYGLTMALGLEPPAKLLETDPSLWRMTAASLPMAALDTRAAGADAAAGAGVLSSAAMVDLYSQIYGADDANSATGQDATRLRDAYLARDPADRLAAMKAIWGGASEPLGQHSRAVLTAYAAARLPVSADYADDAGPLIASMLTAGLDANALRWAETVPAGSEGWALLALAAPRRAAAVETGRIDDFHDADTSENGRKSGFLVAGLAGLERLPMDQAAALAGKYGFRLDRSSRWSQTIDQAAASGNPVLVALLAGAGMQGDGWKRMTPRHLYHIVAALNRVGLSAEARMIAAEAVARG